MDNDPKQYTNEELRQNPIVFFDGVCNLCNRSVNMILRADREKVFRFASLQGETAKNLLPDQGEMPEVWSIMLLDGKGRYRYRWFGKKDTCRMPTGEDQAVFLP